MIYVWGYKKTKLYSWVLKINEIKMKILHPGTSDYNLRMSYPGLLKMALFLSFKKVVTDSYVVRLTTVQCND